MCGICGLFGEICDDDYTLLRQMMDSMAFRGPDDDNDFITATAALGIRRLAIVERDSGRQPYTNENGQVICVFNGEIYNYQELKGELKSSGHGLNQGGDGEVIPHLYEQYGLAFAEKLRGTFAIALYDGRRNRLILIRDRLGVKPLYYFKQSDRIVFASEVKSLLQVIPQPNIDILAFDQYMSYRYVPAPRTIFEGINKLYPGTMLIISLNQNQLQLRSYAYWQLPEPGEGNRSEIESQSLFEELKEALAIRWPKEVAAGYFFSGGLDSSGLAALHQLITNDQARTYSIGFEQPQQTKDYRFFSELEQARNAASQLGTKHYERLVGLSEVYQHLPQIINAIDEPIADPTAIPLYFLSELCAAMGEKVVFSGEGADELFGGYSTYFEPAAYRRYQRIPGWIRGALENVFPGKLERFSLELSERYFGVGGLLRRAQKNQLYTEELLATLLDQESFFPARGLLEERAYPEEERMLRFDTTSWLPENTLMKTDKVTMFHSLEVRLPYLDQKFVEIAAKIPYTHKIGQGQTKKVLRRALSGILPSEIANREKNGFPVPMTAWMREEYKELARNVLLDSGSRLRGFIEPKQLNNLFNGEMPSKTARLIWALYSLEIYLSLNTNIRNSRLTFRRHGHELVPRPLRKIKIASSH